MSIAPRHLPRKPDPCSAELSSRAQAKDQPGIFYFLGATFSPTPPGCHSEERSDEESLRSFFLSRVAAIALQHNDGLGHDAAE